MTYELSSRSRLDDGNINISANVFYNDYEDYQALNSARRVTNIEDAKTYGVEVEASAKLSDAFQINAGLGLLKTEIKRADAAFGDIVGNELNSAPSFTGNIGARYAVTDEFSIGVSGNYVDEYFGSIDNAATREAGGYFLARLNLEYQTANWRITAFVNNAFNAKELTLREPAGGRYPNGFVAIVDPRNIGVSVTYNF